MVFREYKPEEVRKIIKLIREGLNVRNFNENFWEWKFVKGNNKLKTLGFVAEDNGLLAGFASFFPYEMKAGDEEGLCYLVADVVFDKKFRGKGFFAPFYQWALGQVERVDTTVGTYLFSSPLAYPIYTKKFDYHSLGQLKYFIAFGNLSNTASRKLGRILGDITGRVAEAFLSKDFKLNEDTYSFKEISHFDEAFDDLWQKVKDNWRVAIKRTSSFLNWRYFDHPWHKYEMIACYKDRDLKGYIVLNGTRIFDLLYDDESAGLSLISRALKYFKFNGVPIINTMMLGGEKELMCLRKAGFYPYNYRPRPFGLFPPVELLVKPANISLYSNDLLNPAVWKFTEADIDCGI